ncbi:MAG TPA: hypothetical protein VLT45_29835 [Kofleriaceae bacterium]|nr:hypothetical protein [Kofleriaceae bacterium]
MTPIWIAKLRVILVHADGRRDEGHIAVGQPYVLGEPPAYGDADPGLNYESTCPVEITGVWRPEHAPRAPGTLSALVSGIEVLGHMLHAFVSRGGRVLAPEDGTDVDLKSIFGPLYRPIDANAP